MTLAQGSLWSYAAVLVASLSFTLALTPVAFRVARWRGWLDKPGGHKGHVEAMPYLGGAAMALGFATAVLVGSVVFSGPTRGELATIIVAAMVLSVVGLIDDIRHGIGPGIRVAFETVAALVVWRVGSGVDLFPNAGLNALITVLWIVGITNAFNLLDNMDGLSAGVAAIAASFFFLLAATNGQYLVATLAVGLAGCAVAFLRHNFHPARIYMGDCGSMFLGFLVAVLGIKLRFVDAPRIVGLFVPVLVLSVAIFDTTLVTCARLVHRRSPFIGGQDHTSHRLASIGLPVRVAVAVIYASAVGSGWLALVLVRADHVQGLILISFVVVVWTAFGIALGLVPAYETSTREQVVLTRVPRAKADETETRATA